MTAGNGEWAMGNRGRRIDAGRGQARTADIVPVPDNEANAATGEKAIKGREKRRA